MCIEKNNTFDSQSACTRHAYLSVNMRVVDKNVSTEWQYRLMVLENFVIRLLTDKLSNLWSTGIDKLIF